MDHATWLEEARKLVGLKEAPGKANNPEVLALYREAGHAWVKDDAVAWCAAFACAMLERAGIASPKTLRARDFLAWGHAMEAPEPGAIAVFKRGTSPAQGHVAFFLREVGDRIEVLGGNQSDAVTVARYPKSRLLGYRWPTQQRAKPAADARRAPARPDTATVARVQQRLAALGYHEVGKADGLAGKRTGAAILAFRNDHALPLSTAIDDRLLAALMTAAPRAVDPERATASAADLRAQGSTIMAGANTQKIMGAAAATGAAAEGARKTGLLDVMTGAGETAGQAVEALSPFQSLMAILGDWIWLGFAAIGGVVLWQGIKIARARLADHRSGKTPTAGQGAGAGTGDGT